MDIVFVIANGHCIGAYKIIRFLHEGIVSIITKHIKTQKIQDCIKRVKGLEMK